MIQVCDQVLPNPEAYREAALLGPFENLSFGDITFRGIAPPPSYGFEDWFRANFPGHEPTVTFLRQSPEGQVEPNFIHNDVDMGEVTAILYLNPQPAAGDGTQFWECEGRQFGPQLAGESGNEGPQWFCWKKVRAAFNRAVVFDAALFHSRALKNNYGAGDDARLIQVLFAKAKGRA